MELFLNLLVSGIVMGCIYGIVALGYSLIYKASGLMSFVQGDLMTVGAYLGITFYQNLRLPFILAFLLIAIIMFALGMATEALVIRRLRSRGVLPIYVVLATIAISYILQNGSIQIWGTVTMAFPSIFETKFINIFGHDFQTESIFTVFASLIIMVVLNFFMKHTRLGTALRASAMDAVAAKACGINVNLSTGVTWGIAACTAALGGVMLGPIYGVFSTLGANIGTKGFAAAVIGGYGNMFGSIIGGQMLGLLETMVAGYISSDYKNFFSYVVLLIFLFIRPWGLLNERNIKN
jgi:Branched-chain amino acid ABC-type transport system, permease components